MSKQSEAKARQIYVDKLIPNTCSNCVHFRSEIETIPPYNEWCTSYTKEKNMRCALGGFKVKKMGACIEHVARPSEKLNGAPEITDEV